MRKIFKRLKLKWALFVLVVALTVFGVGLSVGWFVFDRNLVSEIGEQINLPGEIKFLNEVYEKIQQNYWDSLSDIELANLFKAGAEKLAGTQFLLETNDREGLAKIYQEIFKNYNQDQKVEFSAKLAASVLASLEPAGRNGLYTKKDEENLINKVSNIDQQKDLYSDLGLSKGASDQEIKLAFEQRSKSASDTDELVKINYAYEVLGDQNRKERYDQNGAQPTVFASLVDPQILHLYIGRFSPVTFDEFLEQLDKFKGQQGLDTLILDLRQNIGGAIDLLPYFLGPFIGNDQYAYEFFHQDERKPFKTKLGWLSELLQYKKVVVLIDGQTQSTGEMMASVLKKYNVGIVAGTKTKGWGTVEKVFELDNQISDQEKYSIFLVHSLTLRDDNQPIQGRGVEPLVDLSQAGWEEEISARFNQRSLVEAIRKIWNSPVPGNA